LDTTYETSQASDIILISQQGLGFSPKEAQWVEVLRRTRRRRLLELYLTGTSEVDVHGGVSDLGGPFLVRLDDTVAPPQHRLLLGLVERISDGFRD
jgi:hypothetical protein